MAIKNIVLPMLGPDGKPMQVVIDEWLHYPLFSTIEIGISGTAPNTSSDAVNLRAFSYIVGQRVPATQSLAARLADERDTNMVKRQSMSYDEAFIFYALTYEPYALGNLGSLTSGAAAGPLKAAAPMASSLNLKRLERDLMTELLVGAQQKKPQFRVPWSLVRQSIGAPAWTSSDQIAPFTNISYGTAGCIRPQNQRKLELPIYIESQQVMFLRVFSAFGNIAGLSQAMRLRIWMDGLKRRPVA